MPYSFTPMNKADAEAICSWQYEEPYAIYSILNEADKANVIVEMLDMRSPHYAVRDEHGELVGFFSYGTSAQPFSSEQPSIYTDDGTITIGLGMRPNFTGKGLGVAFVQAGLDEARQQFAPRAFNLYVMTFNQRAIRVYEKAGFQRVRVYTQHNIHGAHEFLVMSRNATS